MLNNKELLEQIDQRIRLKATGSPKAFAEQIGLSERHLYRVLDFLKSIGCPIVYDKHSFTYKYEEEGQFIICFQKKCNSLNPDEIMDKGDLINTKGGFCEKKSLTDGWWQWRNLYLLRGIHKMFN
ncbi:MAG: hypothetical protein RBR97_18060 [Bacteroidales bacterium]|nr:hypothetical protein [Bacteroidales bacterium]